jgi:hypothetical protein
VKHENPRSGTYDTWILWFRLLFLILYNHPVKIYFCFIP